MTYEHKTVLLSIVAVICLYAVFVFGMIRVLGSSLTIADALAATAGALGCIESWRALRLGAISVALVAIPLGILLFALKANIPASALTPAPIVIATLCMAMSIRHLVSDPRRVGE